MADELFTRSTGQTAAIPQRQGIRARTVLGTALLAFALGGGAVGYAVWSGLIPDSTGLHLPGQTPPLAAAGPAGRAQPAAATPGASLPGAGLPKTDLPTLAGEQAMLETRMAALSERLDTLDLRATAASGNAARAEALLVAFAARRALDRGVSLALLEDQLRLRFGDAQPNAVATVIEAARNPVTLDQLLAGLDAIAPQLIQAPAQDDAWTRIKREAVGLFVFRRAAAPTPAPQAMLHHARVLLQEGRIEPAIAEVRRLPGARGANEWFAAARRYDGARRALDVLETTALIDTRTLRDASGATINRGTGPASGAPSGSAATRAASVKEPAGPRISAQ